MEHRTLLLCVSRFVKKLTNSHQHVSFLVNVYYKKEPTDSLPFCLLLINFTLNQFNIMI